MTKYKERIKGIMTAEAERELEVLVLKMKGGATSQRMLAASGS